MFMKMNRPDPSDAHFKNFLYYVKKKKNFTLCPIFDFSKVFLDTFVGGVSLSPSYISLYFSRILKYNI